MAPHGVLLSVLQAVARQEAAGKAGPLKLARRVCVCLCELRGSAVFAKSVLDTPKIAQGSTRRQGGPRPGPRGAREVTFPSTLFRRLEVGFDRMSSTIACEAFLFLGPHVDMERG